jgi:tRNA(fMet)-specific endonuclease VapC
MVCRAGSVLPEGAVHARGAAATDATQARFIQMSFLLDTNVCIALINDSSEKVRRRFTRAVATKAEVFISSIAIFELWFGVFRSSRVRFNSDRLEAFLRAPAPILPFEDEDARTAGVINAELQLSGQPIGSYDVLLAGHAVARGLTLVTANVSEFSRVKNLSWQDWST